MVRPDIWVRCGTASLVSLAGHLGEWKDLSRLPPSSLKVPLTCIVFFVICVELWWSAEARQKLCLRSGVVLEPGQVLWAKASRMKAWVGLASYHHQTTWFVGSTMKKAQERWPQSTQQTEAPFGSSLPAMRTSAGRSRIHTRRLPKETSESKGSSASGSYTSPLQGDIGSRSFQY